jgi:hypothetical protein
MISTMKPRQSTKYCLKLPCRLFTYPYVSFSENAYFSIDAGVFSMYLHTCLNISVYFDYTLYIYKATGGNTDFVADYKYMSLKVKFVIYDLFEGKIIRPNFYRIHFSI